MVPKTFKINLTGIVINEKTQQPLPGAVEVRVKDKEPVKLRAAANTAKFDTKMPEVTEYVMAFTARRLPAQE